jgi:hypothetical protein
LNSALYGKQLTALLPILFLLGLSACKERAFEKPSVVVHSITAYKCKKECSDLDVNFDLKNPSEIPICFPVRYITPAISKTIALTADSEVKNEQVVADRADSAPAFPDKLSEHIKMLRDEEPNIILQPHSTLPIYAQTGDKYKIPREPRAAEMELFLYPCDVEQYKRRGYFALRSVTKLAFEPAPVAAVRGGAAR